jgi:alkanesulfonate monooxygenase SsuD/methylene tetrahydromethanopterin reductase-like flavin-dependent oxidoreductase (luciferase family)
MEFGIFNLMGSREADKPTAQVFGEVAEQTRLADELGYTVAWFAEHHFSNYCLCASPLMMVAHCAAITRTIRLGTAVVVLPLYNPARLAAEIATADALSNGRLMLGVGAGYQPYEFERFGVDIARNLEMTDEFCDVLDLAFRHDFFRYDGKHYRMPETHIPARPVQNPLPIYVAGHTPAMFRAAARPATPRRCSVRPRGAAIGCSRRAGSAAPGSWPSSMPTWSPRSRPSMRRCPARISPSTASPTSPTAVRTACGSPRTRAIRRGSPPA